MSVGMIRSFFYSHFCLSVCLSRQSMELVVQSPLKSNVGVTQMMEVFSNSQQNTNSSDHIQTKSLPTFEKLLLCSLIVCMRASKKRVCTRAKVRR